MGISEERIDELLEIMLDNSDADGWCHIPEGLTEEEENSLSRRLTIISMDDRVTNVLESILKVIKFMEDVNENIVEYDLLQIASIKKALITIKEDIQTILMDIHSEDLLADFFKFELVDDVIYDSSKVTEDQDTKYLEVRNSMYEIIETEFMSDIEEIKGYSAVILEMCDNLSKKLG